MIAPSPGTLAAVLSNPPLTSGARTLRRVSLAADLLGLARVEVANLFAGASHATREIGLLGAKDAGWLEARPQLCDALSHADAVLLAYGMAAPSGPAREHFRTQVDWLHARLSELALPVWWVGGAPRHPSRWQRWTHREHADLPFEVALGDSLSRADPDTVRVAH